MGAGITCSPMKIYSHNFFLAYYVFIVSLRVWEWEEEGMGIAYSGIPWECEWVKKLGMGREGMRIEWTGMGMLKAIPAHLYFDASGAWKHLIHAGTCDSLHAVPLLQIF